MLLLKMRDVKLMCFLLFMLVALGSVSKLSEILSPYFILLVPLCICVCVCVDKSFTIRMR